MAEPFPALNEADLEESFSHSSGPGGQNVNKVATRVTLRHRPTNIIVTVQDSRSQAANRKLAREQLRRRNRTRPRGAQERILETKHHRSRLKQSRRKLDD